MNDKESLARFGISSKLAYGLMFQSILVIFAAIISIWGIYELITQGASLIRSITNFVSLIVCIALLVYSFNAFNEKVNQEALFVIAVASYIVLIILGLFSSAFDFKNPISLLTLITLISAIFFLHEHTKSFQSANIAMLIVVISGVLVVIFNIMGGMPWFTALKYIIIPVTIGLTYFERVQRGKYNFL